MQLEFKKEKATLFQKFLVAVVVVLIFLVGYFLVARFFVAKRLPAVQNFQECVLAGNPVMESYPRQCVSGGVNFVEDIQQSIERDPVIVPELNANVPLQSPVNFSGKAKGAWFFEATFPVHLYDSTGNLLVSGTVNAIDNWMTTDYVQFTASFDFPEPKTAEGYVEFEKSNPSGLPENAASIRIPVRFK